MIKRDYINMIGKVSDGFGDNGWADGYADLPSDHEQIIIQLFSKIKDEELIMYLDEYLQGYELGEYMSKESFEIYDEDGCLKEDVNLDTCPQVFYAKQLVLQYKKNNKDKNLL